MKWLKSYKTLKSDRLSNVPGSPPSTVSPLTLQQESQMLILLEDLSFEDLNGKIPSTLFMSAEKASASVFFQDLVAAYDGLSALDTSYLNNIDPSPSPSDPSSDSDDNDMVLARNNIVIPNGIYELGALEKSGDYFIATTDKLTLLGNVVFNTPDAEASLILISANSIDLSGASSISYSGEELGIGSFDSLNVENISLKAEGMLSLRSLDSIVLKNAEMITSGKGADFVHVLAANQITADSVAFSSMVKQITMEAMTINLANINFPSGSNVNLNSLYGGVDGKYPNFGTVTQYGRVNFIENMRYGSNLIMNKTNFDQFGSNVLIGTIGK